MVIATSPAAQSGSLFALTICAYRKPGMDEDAYHQYLSQNHAPLLKELMVRNSIVEYTMQHNSSAGRKMMSQIFAKMPESKVADYDSFIHIVFKDIQDFMDLRSDPHYKQVVMPDHEHFADQARTTMVTGWYERHVADGQSLPAEGESVKKTNGVSV